MPNIQSAFKRVRQSQKRRLRNRMERSLIVSVRRSFFETVAAKDVEKCRSLCRRYFSTLDKAVKKGIIPKNTADRRKERAAMNLTKLEKAGAPAA